MAITTEESILDFGKFPKATKAARFVDYAGRPGTLIDDPEEFAVMERYILERYQDAKVVRSQLVGAQYFDCVSRTAVLVMGKLATRRCYR